MYALTEFVEAGGLMSYGPAEALSDLSKGAALTNIKFIRLDDAVPVLFV
jgi:hypothetical protein